MFFYLYLIMSISFCFFLLSIVIYFGRSYINGAPYAVSTPAKTKVIIDLIKKQNKAIKNIKKGKAVDLGSGDGRIVMALAREGYEAYGFESNFYLVWWSRKRIKKAGLEGKAFIYHANYWKHNFSEYDVVTLFGVFYIMEKLQKKLQKELKSEALVVSNYFKFPLWKEVVEDKKIYLYKK